MTGSAKSPAYTYPDVNIILIKAVVIITAITAFSVIAVVCITLGGPPAVVSVAGAALARMLSTALRHLPPGHDSPPPALPE